MKSILLMVLCLPAFLFAEMTVVQENPDNVVIDIQVENLTQNPKTFQNRTWSIFSFDNAVLDEQAGKPAVHYLETLVAVPPGGLQDYQFQVSGSETRQGVDVAPIAEYFVRGEVREVPLDADIYSSAAPYPRQIVQISEPFNFRGVNVVRLQIYPVQYFPQEHRVTIHIQMQIALKFRSAGAITSRKPLSGYEQKMLEPRIVNMGQVPQFQIPSGRGLQKKAVSYDLSSGQWFRIPVNSEGIYQITGSFLKSKGVSLSGLQISDLHLYNYGGFGLPYNTEAPRPQDLNEIAVQAEDQDGDNLMDENDRLLFYGKGMGGWKFNSAEGEWEWDGIVHQRSSSYQHDVTSYPYDDSNYYILGIHGDPAKRIETVPSPQAANPAEAAAFKDYFHFEEDRYNNLASGADWQWLKLSGFQDKETVNFQMPQNLVQDSTGFRVQFKGGSGSRLGDNINYVYNLKTRINDQQIFESTLTRHSRRMYQKTYPDLQALQPGENELEIDHTGNNDGCEVYLEFLEVTVRRPFVAEGGKLHFRKVVQPQQPQLFRVSGFSGTVQVWDISDFADIRRINAQQTGGEVVFQEDPAVVKPAEYFLFTSSAIKSVDQLQPLENHVNLRDPSRRAGFIIITPDEFYDAAAFLEDIRETQVINPLQTERIRLSDIFLEFSSSVRDVTAMRDFLKYAYENWSDSLKFVLLFGDGHYDYRNIELKNVPNYIPPFEISDTYEIDSRESDNFFVDFGFGSGGTYSMGNINPWLPIARLPFNSLAQIDIYREKAVKYEKSYLVDADENGWQNWVTLVSDDSKGGGNSNNELHYHLEPTLRVENQYIPEKFNRARIFLHDYEQVPGGLGRWKPKATEDLLDRINRGTLLINYFGHGDPDTWAHESVLNRSRDLPRLENVFRLPLWVAATCTWGKYDDPERVSMSEELIWLPEKGGIGVISASRPVYVEGNKSFAYSFYNNLFHHKSEVQPSRIVGEAVNMAMGSGANYQKFHLYGDPTLNLADARYRVEIQSIEPDTLKALSTVTVRAVITDQNGNGMPAFQGNAVLQVFDAMDSLSVTEGNSVFRYEYNGGTIFKGLVTVSQGELTGRFIVPKSIKYKHAPTGRISFYAWDPEMGAANGAREDLLFYGSQSQVNDPDGPGIEVAFKDMPSFFDGDFVSSQPTLLVNLSDENGINLTGEVGHRIEVVIDNN
ncbi:MAG: type IX secretion system sortase PorU, partial [Calditrichia bacterium]